MSNITGFTAGSFDLCHTGHLLLLAEAKLHCDWLVVGLHIDPSIERLHKNKPIESVFERTIRLSSSKYVDLIIPYSTEAELNSLIMFVSPQIRFVGDDYDNSTELTGYSHCTNIHYVSRSHGYSSSDLRERIFNGQKK